MMSYLKMDVMQHSDVFEEFRKVTMQQDGLDPVNYFSIPGLSFDSAFKMTKAKIDLLTEESMYEFFEKGIRGRLTQISSHHVKANRVGEVDFDENKDLVELAYIDAVTIYNY